MSIREWPQEHRPREKLLQLGAQSLSDAELLAIFLRVGLPGKSAVDLARDVLAEFGGLRPLMDADRNQFCRVRGLGVAKYTQLKAVLELSRRHLAAGLTAGVSLCSPQAVRDYLSFQLRHRSREVFAVMFLDAQNRLLNFVELFQGTIDSAAVYPREVVKRAIEEGAGAVIFAHNHPSGVAEPSQADIRLTKRLQDALALVDIRVLDHMVVGDQVVSMAEKGLL